MPEHSPEEHFDTFDADGNFIGTAPRSRVHAEGLWHKSVNVFLFDGAGRLWIQRRSPGKDICPGCWDLSVAEHLAPGESWEAGALRGLAEELSVPEVALEPLGGPRKLCFDQPSLGIFDHELKQVFRATWEGPVRPDPVEIDAVRLIELEELARRVRAAPADFTPWLLEDLESTGILAQRSATDRGKTDAHRGC